MIFNSSELNFKLEHGFQLFHSTMLMLINIPVGDGLAIISGSKMIVYVDFWLSWSHLFILAKPRAH